MSSQKHVVMKRSFLVLGLSVFAVFGSSVAGFPGSGGLCTLVLAFLAGLGWGTEKVATRAFDIGYIFHMVSEKSENTKCIA